MNTPAPLRIVTFSTLYPNAAQPAHGLFVEQRLRQLVATGGVEVRVLAPVPWFPFRAPCFGQYARFAAAPRQEERHGLPVAHPRYLLLPKIGMLLAPLLLALGAWPTLRRWQREGWQFQLIDAHYYYPDGVAAALLARWFNVPLTITARGSDLNRIGEYRWPRRMMRWASTVAGASIGVCQALVERLVALGGQRDKTRVLRNGVDLELFSPVPMAVARGIVGGPPQGRRLVCVAALVPVKGHRLLLEALAGLPDWHLDLVGAGPLEAALRQQVAVLGLGARVRLLGAVAQDQLKFHFAAADVTVLASVSEGWPNVLLESMACGTPVVASRVGGVPEVVQAAAAGELFESGSVVALRAALDRLLARQGTVPATVAAADTAESDADAMSECTLRAATRRYAMGFGWAATSEGQRSLFLELIGQARHA